MRDEAEEIERVSGFPSCVSVLFQQIGRIEFGRFAEQNRKRRGEGKPDTFDFLCVFNDISGKNGGTGRFTVRRKTIRKRMGRAAGD